MTITPNGRFLGRKKDSGDPAGDRRFGQFHPLLPVGQLPPSADLRARLPRVFNQGRMQSCEGNAAAALMACLFENTDVFSRLQIYYDARRIDGDQNIDEGCETRDVFTVLSTIGAALESDWPYEQRLVNVAPPDSVELSAAKHRLSSSSRLGGEHAMLSSLAEGRPFVVGVTVHESFDADELARVGVMPMPNVSEIEIGGHAMLACGYDINFRNSETFINSGVDPARCTDEALLLRNSWGKAWGLGGYVWVPLSYVSGVEHGNDCWTGRKSEKGDLAMQVKGQKIDDAELVVARNAVRETVNTFTYMGVNVGTYVTDEQCNEVAAAVVAAVESYRSAKVTI